MVEYPSEHYESMEALLRQVETARRLSKSESSVTNGVGFGGVKLPEAIRLARMGWPEGRAFMSDLVTVGKAQSTPISVKGASLDVGGAFPFIPAACAGDPMNMWELNEDTNKTKPIIRMYIPNVYPAYFNHSHMHNLGGACLTIVDQLENAGFQTELVIYYAASYGNATGKADGIMTCQLKKAGEPLDIDRIAFAICNPAMSRRLWFRIMECSPTFSHLVPGYGYVAQPRSEMIEPNSIVLPSPVAFEENMGLTSQSLGTLETACEWVKAELRKSEFAHLLEIE